MEAVARFPREGERNAPCVARRRAKRTGRPSRSRGGMVVARAYQPVRSKGRNMGWSATCHRDAHHTPAPMAPLAQGRDRDDPPAAAARLAAVRRHRAAGPRVGPPRRGRPGRGRRRRADDRELRRRPLLPRPGAGVRRRAHDRHRRRACGRGSRRCRWGSTCCATTGSARSRWRTPSARSSSASTCSAAPAWPTRACSRASRTTCCASARCSPRTR